jgi:hypothetical protein
MNVEIKESESKWKFPCWGKSINNESVVYFVKDRCGMIVVENSANKVGQHSELWIMEYFQPCFNPFEEKEQEKEIKFPCLMQRKDEPNFIVLFRNRTNAIAVKSIQGYLNEWVETDRLLIDKFQPFHGSITIQND